MPEAATNEGTGNEVVFPENWKEGLPEELRSNSTIQNTPDVQTLAKTVIDSQSYIGKLTNGGELMPFPKSDDERMDFMNKLGRPETPEGYTFDEIQYPEGFPSDDGEFLNKFKTIAHETGLLPAQVKAIHSWYENETIESFKNSTTENQKAMEDASTELKKDFGNAYEQKLEVARRTARSFAGDKFDALTEKYGNDPDFIRIMAKIGESMGEDQFVGQGDSDRSNAQTPDKARERISMLQGDQEFQKKYTDRRHPLHKQAVDEMAELYRDAFPQSVGGVT